MKKKTENKNVSKRSKGSDLTDVDKLALKIVDLRKRPLFVMYYPELYGFMREDDTKDIYDEFRRRNQNPHQKRERLDVLLHTIGGDPNTAYRIAQIIRDFSKHVTMLIPFYAFSGGTLTCLGANEIRYGHYAVLSPIDITIESEEIAESVELMNIDYYMNFVGECRTAIEESLIEMEKRMPRGKKLKTDVEEPLFVELVKQVGALNIGMFFRERTLTGHYAEVLLDDYMFNGRTDKVEKRNNIIRKLLFECPSHDFHIDYHIAKKWGLPVEEMTTEESDLTKALVSQLRKLEERGIICKYIEKKYKLPFFRLYVGGE